MKQLDLAMLGSVTGGNYFQGGRWHNSYEVQATPLQPGHSMYRPPLVTPPPADYLKPVAWTNRHGLLVVSGR